ncbi:MAG: hypothetical protein ACLFV6_13165 [Spirulinaceae cyanobacterium]
MTQAFSPLAQWAIAAAFFLTQATFYCISLISFFEGFSGGKSEAIASKYSQSESTGDRVVTIS